MKFSKTFRINKTQPELDFVDIPLETDIPLFIDPYAISRRTDIWSIECHNLIINFFQQVIDSIRNNDPQRATHLLSGLGEPNDTRLGLSQKKPQGKGVSGKQAGYIFEKLKDSEAVRTGLITEISDCELMVDGIGYDKISDITTKIIKRKLIDYTIEQCILHGITVKGEIASGDFWDSSRQEWTGEYFNLPSFRGNRIILVPKAIVRRVLEYDYQQYYHDFILNFLEHEHLNASSSLVRTLKDGRRVVYKKDLEKLHPCRKEFIYQFSRTHPEILQAYKNSRAQDLTDIDNIEIDPEQLEDEIGVYLINGLKGINPGIDQAGSYHNLMIGTLEYLFYPFLMYPVKENEIHEGRKRIDIRFDNAAKDGFFNFLRINKIPSMYIYFECKNYSRELNNPELDQIAGRFNPQRGKFGFIICRSLQDKKLFLKRCNDTVKDNRGSILPLDDEDITRLLLYRKDNKVYEMDKYLRDLFSKIMQS